MASDPDLPKRGLSVRAQVVGLMTVLLLSALTIAGATVYAIESQRIVRDASAQAQTDLGDVQQVQAETPARSGAELLDAVASRQVLSDNQRWALWEGAEFTQISPDRADPVMRETAITDAMGRLSEVGGQDLVKTAYGDALVSVQPLALGTGQTALGHVILLREQQSQLADTMQVYALIAALAAMLACLVAAWQAGIVLKPLRLLNDTAREISEEDLSRRIVGESRDEIGDLAVTFNQMLDRLETSFVAQRRLLDDAGHELRTPLTIMRGHLEIIDHDDPVEVRETLQLVTEEVDRMSGLVEDLILLSKANRPDFLSVALVDAGSWLAGVTAKASALGERDWQLEITKDGVFSADPHKLTQAVLQLAHNAVKHSEPGSPIIIGAAVEEGRTRIWVKDRGDGIPLHMRQSIFERFQRADVRPGDEGSGLGLAIVRAIVEAHLGWVGVEDNDPRGSTFIITLPHQEASWPES